VTRREAQAILADNSKRIEGDIVWAQHPDINFAVRFRVRVQCAVDPDIQIAGYYNRENNKLYLNMFRRSDGKPFVRLCMESGHHNPACTEAGDPHLHEWDDDEGDKIAGAVTFDTSGSTQQIWREFCAWTGITHEGVLESVPPFQKEMF